MGFLCVQFVRVFTKLDVRLHRSSCVRFWFEVFFYANPSMMPQTLGVLGCALGWWQGRCEESERTYSHATSTGTIFSCPACDSFSDVFGFSLKFWWLRRLSHFSEFIVFRFIGGGFVLAHTCDFSGICFAYMRT